MASRCDFDKGLTSVDGACVSAAVDSSKLQAFAADEVYGDGGLLANGAPASCFDVQACFAGATAVAGLDTGTCTFPLPAGVTPSTLNLALVTPATGACLAPGACYVPLVNDATAGWTVRGGTVTMPTGVCAKLGAGVTLSLATGTCPAQTASDPVCEPTGADAGAPPADAAGPDADATAIDATGADAGEPPIDARAPLDAGTGDATADANDAGDSGVVTIATAAELAAAGLGASGATLYSGLTSDGYVPLVDSAGRSLCAVSVAGGPITPVTSIPSSASSPIYLIGDLTAGPAVFWAGYAADGGADNDIWTSSSGLVELSPEPMAGFIGASADGTMVAYETAPVTGNVVVDQAVSHVDGSATSTLFTGVSKTGCGDFLGFAGNMLISVHCVSPDGGPVAPTLSVFPGGSAALESDLATIVDGSASFDAAGDLVFAAIDGTNEGAVFAVPGGAKTHIDTNVTAGLMTPDGTGVVYLTTGGAIRFATTTSPSPTTVVTSGAAGLLAISPDGSTVAYYASGSGSSTDLWLAPAKTMGTPVQVVATPTASMGQAQGLPSFTADSSRALYLTNVSALNASATLSAVPVAGGASTNLGTVSADYLGSSASATLFAFQAPTGAVVVFLRNGVSLVTEDLATGRTATYGVSGPFGITPDSTRVVFTGAIAGSYGLYTAPVAP
jgi:hypothetical protein